MTAGDGLAFAWGALRGHRLRTTLTVAGMAVGIGAVLALTAFGEGARRYVVQEFAALGSNLLIVLPGRVETTGAAPFGGVVRDLTLEDFQAVQRVAGVNKAAPLASGAETVRFGDLSRAVPVLGTTVDFAPIRRLVVAQGSFLPERDPHAGGFEIVLGFKVTRELFGSESPLGKNVRVGPYRFRVVGVLGPRGRGLGFDFDELVFIPVRTAMRIFNRTSLFRILVECRNSEDMEAVRARVEALLAARHRAQDVTVISQDALVAAFSSILQALTWALAGIAAVSLLVAGIGIMNVMLVAVTERRREIGLLKAVGVTRGQVMAVFLTEALVLSGLGGVLGLALGTGSVKVFVRLYPSFPAAPPLWAFAAALAVAFGVGTVFGLLPAARAARVDPVLALSGGVR
ncbi:MAG: ABC transporter permease [Thermoanaerobaculum sp.]|nr:MAG: ABC transporter permease [Thermoanaerobaculum sp.]